MKGSVHGLAVTEHPGHSNPAEPIKRAVPINGPGGLPRALTVVGP